MFYSFIDLFLGLVIIASTIVLAGAVPLLIVKCAEVAGRPAIQTTNRTINKEN